MRAGFREQSCLKTPLQEIWNSYFYLLRTNIIWTLLAKPLQVVVSYLPGDMMTTTRQQAPARVGLKEFEKWKVKEICFVVKFWLSLSFVKWKYFAFTFFSGCEKNPETRNGELAFACPLSLACPWSKFKLGKLVI